MRITIIAPPWVPVPPISYGGVESVLDSLARGLHEAGHDVMLVTTGDSTCPVPKTAVFDEALGVGVPGSAAEIRHVFHAYSAAIRHRSDVVHDHTLIGPLYSVRFPSLPVVTTNHGPFGSDLGDGYRALGGRLPIIAVSNDQAAGAEDIPIAAVIHHGVSLEEFEPGSGQGGYALVLGRMHPDKGIDTACRVARRAGVPLIIAAKMREPQERRYFQDCVEPLLDRRIQYIGEVDNRSKRQLLRAATCLLNPIAWREPFGMVIIEALASGTPVLARPIGSAPELVDDGLTGALRHSESDLAAALTDMGRYDRGLCRRTAGRRFSSRRMVAEHVALYERAIQTWKERDPGLGPD